tara:strand:+ start:518 stop:1828 length:1311 start_codon:yes stop_codon:yes gene_type:complete
MRNIVCIALIALCFNVQAQKKELRKIDKLVLESFWEEAKDELETSKSLILSSQDKYRAQYYFYDAVVSYELENFKNSINSYNNLITIDKSFYPTNVEERFPILQDQIYNSIVNSAILNNNNKEYLIYSEKLIMAYEFDKDRYVEALYYAAGGFANAKDLDKALEYYLILKALNYTGVVDEYFITNNETGIEEQVSSITEYELLKAQKNDYSNPRIGQTESRFPEIIKNIALIYTQQGKNELAEEAMYEARQIEPDNVSLLMNEATIFIRISNTSSDKDKKELYRNKFKNSMQKAIELDPTNGLNYYNLGVIYFDQGEIELSKENYKRAIELLPDYANAHLNLVMVILNDEIAINEEISSLVDSNKQSDFDRIDELKEMKQVIYKESLPILLNYLDLAPEDLDALEQLSRLYYVLDDEKSWKETMAKIQEIKTANPE